jgi:hypothetical protein
MQELIKRLEEATEGSAGLDHEIADAVGFPMLARAIPYYTTSLDAALTLVPEGAIWTISCGDGEPGFAFIDTGGRIEEHDAATPALALCIAALRARSGEEYWHAMINAALTPDKP